MRLHRVTHPVLGPASWREIQHAAGELRKQGRRVCSWCFGDVPKGARTRCGKEECQEGIWRAYSPGHCAFRAVYRQKCPCGKHAMEADHIIPVSLGGTGDAENLRALCTTCHGKATTRLRRLGPQYIAVVEHETPLPPLRK